MSNTLLEEISSSAVFSPCGNFRYQLRRDWNDGQNIAWLMLNPSIANANENDPTLKRVLDFSRRWGYGSLVVVNLAAHISSNPKRLKFATDPIGPLTDYWVKKSIDGARELLCAWGSSSNLGTDLLRWRPHQLLTRIREWEPQLSFSCLGVNQDGSPKHPLYISPLAKRKPYPYAP